MSSSKSKSPLPTESTENAISISENLSSLVSGPINDNTILKEEEEGEWERVSRKRNSGRGKAHQERTERVGRSVRELNDDTPWSRVTHIVIALTYTKFFPNPASPAPGKPFTIHFCGGYELKGKLYVPVQLSTNAARKKCYGVFKPYNFEPGKRRADMLTYWGPQSRKFQNNPDGFWTYIYKRHGMYMANIWSSCAQYFLNVLEAGQDLINDLTVLFKKLEAGEYEEVAMYAMLKDALNRRPHVTLHDHGQLNELKFLYDRSFGKMDFPSDYPTYGFKEGVTKIQI